MKQSSEKREVIVAKTAGFCFGVERAVNEVYKQIQLQKKGKPEAPSIPTVRLSTMKRWSGIWRRGAYRS